MVSCELFPEDASCPPVGTEETPLENGGKEEVEEEYEAFSEDEEPAVEDGEEGGE